LLWINWRLIFANLEMSINLTLWMVTDIFCEKKQINFYQYHHSSFKKYGKTFQYHNSSDNTENSLRLVMNRKKYTIFILEKVYVKLEVNRYEMYSVARTSQKNHVFEGFLIIIIHLIKKKCNELLLRQSLQWWIYLFSPLAVDSFRNLLHLMKFCN
jgi:hypothetical protein